MEVRDSFRSSRLACDRLSVGSHRSSAGEQRHERLASEVVVAAFECVEAAVSQERRPGEDVAFAGAVGVRVGGAGVCATDLHAIDGLMEPAGVTLPRVLGHENAGWVEAVGDGVTTVAPGDPVILYPPYSCGLCVACRA